VTTGHLHNIWAHLKARWYFRSATYSGARVRVWGKVIIKNQGGKLHVGERVRIQGDIVPVEFGIGENGSLDIGERTYINYGTSISATDLVRIGPECNIGTYVMIMDNNFHCLEPERRQERPPSSPIILEENVWLGGRVIVLGGVTIGTGSVVGAGSVVTHDIPQRSLAVGVPAKVIRQL
jgi:acetyltransferase-like isoleucine patch superfamily enzyme